MGHGNRIELRMDDLGGEELLSQEEESDSVGSYEVNQEGEGVSESNSTPGARTVPVAEPSGNAGSWFRRSWFFKESLLLLRLGLPLVSLCYYEPCGVAMN